MNTLSRHRRPLFQRSDNATRSVVAFLVLCTLLMLADLSSQRLSGLRSTLMSVAWPIVWVAEQPAALRRFASFLSLRASELDAYEQLQRTHLQLMARLQRVEALEAENRRLRALLSSSEVLEARALVAEVLAASQDPYEQRLTLNRGHEHGVYRGQAVIDAGGVLGQVVQVHARTANALLITDPDHGIPVEVNRTGLQTIAIGSGDGHTLSLPFLPGNADIQVDDLLVSSSLGGRFPSGYPVARVRELRFAPGASFMEAIALPEARVNQSRQVLLLWDESQPPPEPVTPDVDAEPPEPPRSEGDAATAAPSSLAAPGTPEAPVTPGDAQ